MRDREVVLIVTGSRKRGERHDVRTWLTRWHKWLGKPKVAMFVGDATGADEEAYYWVTDGDYGAAYVFRADWKAEAEGAGPKRNQRMCEAALTYARSRDVAIHLLAFPGARSRGTWQCVGVARKLGDIDCFVLPLLPRGKTYQRPMQKRAT